jgi:hypothetical protein
MLLGLSLVLLIAIIPWLLYCRKETKKQHIQKLQSHKKNLLQKKRIHKEIEETELKIQFLSSGITVQPPRTPEEEMINSIIVWANNLRKQNQ